MPDLPEWESTVQKGTAKLRSVLVHLHKIWEEIGFTEDARSMYRNQVYSHVEDLLNDMIAESEERKAAMLKNIKQLMEEISIVCKELRTDVQTSSYEHLPLKDIEEALRSDLHKLQYCKEQRVSHLKELLAKEKSICKALGSQPIGIEKHLPSEEELNSFRLYLEKQECEKNRVESVFKEMRRAVVKMIDELGLTPSLNFELLVCKEPENFVFNTSNMTKLRELRDQLKVQIEETKQNVDEMKQEIIALWKYLDEPEHVCQSFLNSYVGYSVTTINAFTTELKRCKEKRRLNISKYVMQVRSELVKLWDLCKYSEDQRKQFAHFNSHTYTEDLLTLHELEVERVQKFYELTKPVFDLLEERENLWKKMKELLQRANNPDRFYNRGGQLLTEEKERKTIQKKLPKIEEQLRCLVHEYEIAHGESLTVDGMSIDDLLKESWENLNEERETNKKSRKEAKDKSIKKAPLNASRKGTSSASRKTPTIISTRRLMPLSSSKRKLQFSPSPNSSAKRKNLSFVPTKSKLARTGKVSRRLLQSENKSMNDNQKQKHVISQNSVASVTSYGQFKEHLKDKGERCSSLIPDQVLMNATRSGMRTPVRTPAKPLRKNMTLLSTPNGTPKLSHSHSSQKIPHSPRMVSSSRLAPVSTPLPIIF